MGGWKRGRIEIGRETREGDSPTIHDACNLGSVVGCNVQAQFVFAAAGTKAGDEVVVTLYIGRQGRGESEDVEHAHESDDKSLGVHCQCRRSRSGLVLIWWHLRVWCATQKRCGRYLRTADGYIAFSAYFLSLHPLDCTICKFHYRGPMFLLTERIQKFTITQDLRSPRPRETVRQIWKENRRYRPLYL